MNTQRYIPVTDADRALWATLHDAQVIDYLRMRLEYKPTWRNSPKNTRIDLTTVNVIFLMQAAKLAGFKMRNGQFNKYSLIAAMDISTKRKVANILRQHFNIAVR